MVFDGWRFGGRGPGRDSVGHRRGALLDLQLHECFNITGKNNAVQQTSLHKSFKFIHSVYTI